MARGGRSRQPASAPGAAGRRPSRHRSHGSRPDRPDDDRPEVPADGRPDRPDDGPPPVSADGRRETAVERSDRNWNELLQELRVTQTGVQILMAFLLTMPFQARFDDLDEYQRTLFLVLVLLAVLTTGLIVAPVSLHRIMFGKHLKRELVRSADRLARAGLLTLAVTIAGASMLVFDVVASRTAGRVVGAAVLVVLGICWLAYPLRVTRAAEVRAGTRG